MDEVRATADALHSAAIHLLRAARVDDSVTGLTPSRLSALSVIVFAGPVTIGELASAEGIRSPSATGLVNALERDRLVERLPHPDDQRSVRVRATAKGRRLLARGRARRLDHLTEVLATLPQAKVLVLRRAAGLIEAALSQR